MLSVAEALIVYPPASKCSRTVPPEANGCCTTFSNGFDSPCSATSGVIRNSNVNQRFITPPWRSHAQRCCTQENATREEMVRASQGHNFKYGTEVQKVPAIPRGELASAAT